MKLPSLLTAFILVFGPMTDLAKAGNPVGFKQFDLADSRGDRPLKVSVWYPTSDDGPVTAVGETPAFLGQDVIKNGRHDERARPLVVLSHGYGGSWRNLGWLAESLVHEGYVVAAPDHPGTTTFDRSAIQAARLSERPRDLSRVIDQVIADPSIAGPILPSQIAAIGHSLGGWTVMALGGARFSTSRLRQDCSDHPNPRTCGLAAELGLNDTRHNPVEADLRDGRVRAVISLDLGLARGFTPESLADYQVPALIVAAGIDIGDLPAALESGFVADQLPARLSRYVVLDDAMHFSFLQLCKPGAVDRIEKETPGDGIVCRDGGTRSRETLHGEVADLIVQFWARAVPAGAP